MRIVDIAEELGVSTATVSNVIHGKTKKISDETVKRVQQLLEEKQYIPSMAGILLAQNNSRIIGVVINDHEKYEGHVLEDAFISTSLNHLSREIEDSGLFMMIKVTQDWNEIIRFASMWNMEGMIIIGFCEQDYQKLREKMRIPFVVYDGFFEEAKRICNLSIDDYNGGKQMGIYFRQQGYEKALCISDNDICGKRFHRICICHVRTGCSDRCFACTGEIHGSRHEACDVHNRLYVRDKHFCLQRHCSREPWTAEHHG